MNKNIDFSYYFSSPELLAKAVLSQYKNEIGNLEFPINPFKILKSLDVKLLIKNFNKLEGLYIPAQDEDDIDMVAINFNRPIHRQRFTAAHEICHCIKDKQDTVICPISGKKNDREKFADKFAASLLMPIDELEKQSKKYVNENGYINLEDVIYISEYFGVSLETCVYRIAYVLHKIEGDIESQALKKRLNKIKPEKLREKFGIKNILNLTRELADFYCYARPKENNNATHIKFKQFLILNENKLEGVDISEEKLNYILADIRLNNDFSKYQNEEDKNILEALGNIEMLDYVLNTKEEIDVWKIAKLQQMLYKYTPFGKDMIFPRQSDNRISGAEISTVEHSLIIQELIKVGENINKLIKKKENLTLHEYVLETLKIHHRLTVIHPLNDGNGRCCRAILLWLLRLKNIPPIYIKSEDKLKYINALNQIDTKSDYDYLELLILQQIINSMVIFDEKLLLN